MPDKRDLEPLLTNQQNDLNVIFSDSNGIDAKALALLAANFAILIFIDQVALHVHIWEFIILYALFVLSLLLDFATTWPRKYTAVSVDLDTSPEYLHMDRETLLLQLLSDTESASRKNRQINKLRLRLTAASLMLTGLGFLILLVIL